METQGYSGSKWDLFKQNKRHFMVAFILLMWLGITIDEATTHSVFYDSFSDPAYWAITVFLGLLITIIIIGNEKHYKELKNGQSS